jgi:pilus assembly protein Flp/PilA
VIAQRRSGQARTPERTGRRNGNHRRCSVVSEKSVMKNLFARFAKDESGATAIEYGLIAALIAVACVVTWGAIGTQMNTKFDNIKTNLSK